MTIEAKMLTEQEFKTKQAELEALNSSIEVWSGTNIPKKDKETIDIMLNDLSKDLHALDCAYLLKTIEVYKDVLEIMKAPVK
jgi:hypothetical protein